MLNKIMPSSATWTLDPAHSNLGFKVKHMLIANVNGRFDRFTATLNYDANDPLKSSVQVTAEINSINTGIEQRDQHLHSSDFFDAANFPQLTFISKKIIKSGDQYQVIGDLTMRGTTKEITLIVDGPTPPLNDPWGDVRIAVSATGKFNRFDYGLAWNSTIETGGLVAGDQVNLIIDAEFKKNK